MRMKRKARLRKKSLNWRRMLALNSTQGPWAYLRARDGGKWQEAAIRGCETWEKVAARATTTPYRKAPRQHSGRSTDKPRVAGAPPAGHAVDTPAAQAPNVRHPSQHRNTAHALVLRQLAVPIGLRFSRHLQLLQVKGAVPAKKFTTGRQTGRLGVGTSCLPTHSSQHLSTSTSKQPTRSGGRPPRSRGR